MTFVSAKVDTQLYVKDWGQGAPVILIHGWPLDADMWEYQALALAEAGHRVITYDRRGFGRSCQPYVGYDYDTMAADLAKIIEAKSLTDVTLVGFSMGGGEVARYIGTYGTAKIKRAALIASVVPFMLQTADNPGADQKVFDDMKAGIRTDRAAFFADFGKTFYGADKAADAVSQPILDWTLSLAMMGSIKATLDCVDAFGTTDFRNDLEKFDVPTLLVHGTADEIVPIDISARKAKKIKPDADLKEYEGAPHGLFMTHKDKHTADLLVFHKTS